MIFPVVVQHRKAEAKIYGKSDKYPFYRVAAYVGGKRRMASYGTYGEAKAAADVLVKALAKGSTAAALTARQAADALAALERLQSFQQSTGRRLSLLAAVSELAEVSAKLNGLTLREVVTGYLATVATIRRVDLLQAVDEFIKSREHRTIATSGKRPELSAGYAYNVAMWLREFAGTFPNTAVCDLKKDLLNGYLSAFSHLSARSRNVRRIVVSMFLKWCVRQDYLTAGHRLLEADRMSRENDAPESIEFYKPAELRSLLKNAKGEMRVVIALQALAGLRLEETLRLDWRDVFGIPGHVEVSTSKSKTRQRRLVQICPSLEQWLAPYRDREGKLAAQWQTVNGYAQAFAAFRNGLEIPSRKNGLRHGFVTFHFALHANENLTSAQAGNSPTMIHAHYKGLATKAEAEKWFSVEPAGAAETVVPQPVGV